MADYIKRADMREVRRMTVEQAIEELKQDISLYETDICKPGDGTPDGDLMEALTMAIVALEHKCEWISVKDALPEYKNLHMDFVLAYPINGEILAVPYDDNIEKPEDRFGYWRGHHDPDTLGWVDEDWEPLRGITHWMPLPKPPVVEVNDD